MDLDTLTEHYSWQIPMDSLSLQGAYRHICDEEHPMMAIRGDDSPCRQFRRCIFHTGLHFSHTQIRLVTYNATITTTKI